jgi:hypothetical protein
LTNWDPSASFNSIHDLEVIGETVYAAGEFDIIGGQTRHRIAALDAETGLATAWNPDAGDDVLCMEVSGQTMYIGGRFLTVGGLSRSRLAAVNLSTGLPTAWNPGANAGVLSLLSSEGTIYAGGEFTQVNGVQRFYTAAVDEATGVLSSWDPHATGILDGGLYASGSVNTIGTSGSTVYLGGDFINILDGAGHSFIAGVSAAPPSLASENVTNSTGPRSGEFTAGQSFPNPFNPVTQIEFNLPSAGHATITVYNALGEEVDKLADEILPGGVNRISFNGSTLPSGMYFYRIAAAGDVRTGRMLLLK